MRRKSAAIIWVFVCLVFAPSFFCQPSVAVVREPSQKCPIQLQEKWVLAYASDFSEDTLRPEWVVTAGNALVSQGVLVLRSDKADAEIILKEPCFSSPSVRMELSAYVPDYAKLSEISPFLNSNYGSLGETRGCSGSYLFQFGSEQDTTNRLRRVGKIVEETVNNKVLLKRHHLYHIVAENDCGHIRLEIDGTTIFEWNDAKPIWGPEHCHVGFYTSESVIIVEWVKIYHKVAKP